MASIQLRALIDSILADISRDMREQADVVETEFARRIAEMSDAMQKMIYNMREVIYAKGFIHIIKCIYNLDIKSNC
jgi:predicted transcriptional regulator